MVEAGSNSPWTLPHQNASGSREVVPSAVMATMPSGLTMVRHMGHVRSLASHVLMHLSLQNISITMTSVSTSVSVVYRQYARSLLDAIGLEDAGIPK